MNESQLEAVQFADGALLLLAGPGSGKTTVITHRIQYLISHHGVSPEKILVITFTKAAAMEMKERFLRLMQTQQTEVVFGTFHAIFYQILRSAKAYRNLTLINEKERAKLIKTIMKDINQNNPFAEADLQGIVKQISKYKNDPDTFYDFLSDTLDEEQFSMFLEEYKRYMEDMGKIDFDDMVLLCYQLLLADKGLYDYWSSRFTYFLIDEFQDINKLQYEVIKLLCRKNQNLFVVGDDDQSIYGFRGARPDFMKIFLKDFEKARKLTLNVNYRCAKGIVEAANLVISDNKNRFNKEMKSHTEMPGELNLRGVESQKAEFTFLTNEIKELAKQGIAYEDIAILCRTNRDLMAVATALDFAKLPFAGEKFTKTMFDQTYIRGVVTYLTYLAGNHSRDIFFQFMNRPLRFIKRESIQTNVVFKERLLNYYKDNPGIADTIRILFDQLDRMEGMKPALAIHYLRKVVGYDRYVKAEANEEEYEAYCRLVELLQEYAKKYSSFSDFVNALEEMKNQKAEKDTQNGVKLYTYHGSKGLEFDCVFLPGLIQGQVPPKQARTADAIEEERRMFYVAMTRAKNRLTMSWYENEGAVKSVFLCKLYPLISGRQTHSSKLNVFSSSP